MKASLLSLLICSGLLRVSGLEVASGSSWSKQTLPVLLDTHVEILTKPLFKAEAETRGAGVGDPPDPTERSDPERMLGYETLHENGTCTRTHVELRGFNGTSSPGRSEKRRKRQVFGSDGRFVITDSNFITNYPFSAAARLSSGCSGVLVSPKHVLTAARCVHDGRFYLDTAKRLKVGLLQLKTRRRRRRRRGRKGGLLRKHQKEEEILVKRDRRSARPQRPVFRWTRVKEIKIPQGWIDSEKPVSLDFDYALLEMKRPAQTKPMVLGVAPSTSAPTRIHFSGYDFDKNLLGGGGQEKVVYRFCPVVKESDDLMYQHCDARPGSAGAGVYVRMRDGAKEGRWRRRVIGVFSGHRWVEEEEDLGGPQTDFNVAVRITPAKYAQICHWINEDPGHCREV